MSVGYLMHRNWSVIGFSMTRPDDLDQDVPVIEQPVDVVLDFFEGRRNLREWHVIPFRDGARLVNKSLTIEADPESDWQPLPQEVPTTPIRVFAVLSSSERAVLLRLENHLAALRLHAEDGNVLLLRVRSSEGDLLIQEQVALAALLSGEARAALPDDTLNHIDDATIEIRGLPHYFGAYRMMGDVAPSLPRGKFFDFARMEPRIDDRSCLLARVNRGSATVHVSLFKGGGPRYERPLHPVLVLTFCRKGDASIVLHGEKLPMNQILNEGAVVQIPERLREMDFDLFVPRLFLRNWRLEEGVG